MRWVQPVHTSVGAPVGRIEDGKGMAVAAWRGRGPDAECAARGSTSPYRRRHQHRLATAGVCRAVLRAVLLRTGAGVQGTAVLPAGLLRSVRSQLPARRG